VKRNAWRDASVAAEAFGPPFRERPKRRRRIGTIFSSRKHEEMTMPTVDLLLPAQPYSVWHPKQRRARVLVTAIGQASAVVARWIERARQRHALGELDDHLLRDIGITRVDAARESEKPFWR
jgi:uncharacterized protein YjiS (DUF1127 family)